jgi:NADPH:quinone reductase-like Zn-dependent oxidoreductase
MIDEVAPGRLGPRDLRVAIHAAAVNPVDCKIRSGGLRGLVRLDLPARLGMDMSGVVTEVGGAVDGFAVGNEVFSSTSHRRMGTYAEEIVVRAEEVAKKPRGLSHQEAAGLSMVGLTAWNALVGFCNLQPGQRVLIQAGSGGVGSTAIQLAKHLGAEVLATCSTRNLELVTDLGADVAIDYTEERYDDIASGCDAVLESLGGEHLGRALRTVRRGGRVASITTRLPAYTKRYGPWLGLAVVGLGTCATMIDAWLLRGRKLALVTRRPSGATLAKLAGLAENGALRPVIDRVYPLDEVAAAHAHIETGHARGKVVLAVR